VAAVSNKMTCLGCNSYTSAIYDAYQERSPCPTCGLAADATERVLAARKRLADEDLIQRYQEAEVRAGRAEAEATQLRRHLDAIQRAVANPPEADEVSW
jgi:hypothetical protein